MSQSSDVVNEALQLIGGDITPVTGSAPNFDDSAAGLAAKYLYNPTVGTVARQFGWDFSRSTVALELSGNTAPFPWPLEYIYPPDGIEIRQLMPASLDDPNNPVPTNYVIANAIVSGVLSRVIQTNVPNASVVYTNKPSESTWDPLFREAVVRLLASGLSMALAGRPETAMQMLESGAQFEKLGEGRFD